MSMPLHLEYACTVAELEEAESLSLRKQLGGGSKWLTWLVLGVMLAAGLAALHFIIIHRLAAAYRPFAWAGFILLVLFIHFKNRREKVNRATRAELAKVELSENEITFGEEGAKLVRPWSSFTQCLESKNLFLLLDKNKTTVLIFPKRAFPDENWQAWFRNQTSRFAQGTEMTPRIENLNPATLTPPSGVRLTVRLRYRDYLDHTLASWQTWGIIGGIVGMVVGTGLYSAAHPPPHPVYSSTQVFLMAVLPFLAIMTTMGIAIKSVHAWRSGAKFLGPEEIIFGDETITFAAKEAAGVLPWTTYTWFKETRRSFILWQRGSRAWLLLPKRQFQSAEEVDRMRSLLAKHLTPSRWFFG